jgi:hypothetical protein
VAPAADLREGHRVARCRHADDDLDGRAGRDWVRPVVAAQSREAEAAAS